MDVSKNNTLSFYLWGLIFFCLALTINGIIPFYAIPAREQAIWALGFAKSFTHGPFFSIFAHDFGYPQPAAISFGLPAVIPMSWLLRIDLRPELVYDLVFAGWYLIAFSGGYKFCKHYGLKSIAALAGAAIWLITPIVVDHNGYGMLSLGMALLPFYLYCCVRLVQSSREYTSLLSHGLYAFSAIVAIFMDGYTFVIFAVMSSGFILFSVLTKNSGSSARATWICCYHAIVFAVSYLLYTAFIGKSNYTPSDMDFFRGWGVDISYLLIPTANVHWLFDALHLSVHRNMANHYGDNSVWVTTFILPLLLIMPLAIYLGIKGKINSMWLLCLSLFLVGLYLSLGPSVKFFSLKPVGGDNVSPLMPANAAWFATGNAFIYEHVPGVNVMRATYRWMALCFMMAWWMLILVLSSMQNKKVRAGVIVLMFAAFVPVLPLSFTAYHNGYKAFTNVDEFLIEPLNRDLQGAKKIVFLPWGNDFFANYLAPMLHKRTYNIGGDKNLDAAYTHFPQNMFPLLRKLDNDNAGYMVKMLLAGEADAIIIPYFDMIWYPGIVHDDAGNIVKLTGRGGATKWISNENRAKFLPVVKMLQKETYLDIKDNLLYAVIRLNHNGVSYPVNFNVKEYQSYLLTAHGWYSPEPDHIWSQAEATLNLPVNGAPGSKHRARLHLFVYDAKPDKPKTVVFSSSDNPSATQKLVSKGGPEVFDYEFTKGQTTSQLHLKVEDAVSPQNYGMADDRVLGIFLTQIEMLN